MDQFNLDSVRAYYDDYERKLLADYVFGNPRVEGAIKFALSWISDEARRVWDIGRGIGWSSWMIKQHRPKTTVLAVDLSPRLTEIAQSLFSVQGIDYLVGDVTEFDSVEPGTIDVAVLIDVYEHIPCDRRARLHSILDKALAPNGVVILTFPSLRHQAYLRKHKPSGLQPVDEDVTRANIELLAKEAHGYVVHYEEVSVWTDGDYVHAVISRVPGKRAWQENSPLESEGIVLRKQRVLRELGLDVLPGGIFPSHRGDSAICIVSPSLNTYSETFIRAHIEQLPAETHVLYGGHLPTYADDGESLIQKYNVLQRLRFRLKQQSRGLPWDHEAKHERAIERFLQEHQIQAVLAEYGPTGVAMMEICERVGIPLVVHFHGYDAYRDDALGTAGKRYPELFDIAAAIIAVSHDMEKQLIALGAPRGKVHLNPCGVDLSQFGGALSAEASPVFVGVGRFVDKKGPLLTLLAFRTVLDRVPDARLVMIGDGPLWEASKQLARALGVAHAVELPGVQSHGQVAGAMRQARAFVQHSLRTSYGDSEGTPVAVLEACATGLPVVSTRHAGIPDVVLDGETGFLVDEGDVEGMAEAMLRLARDPQLAARMGQAGHRRTEQHFSMEKSIRSLWRIIENSLKGPPICTRIR
jgi:glycosyltransferase involved in cell wall biosynthesis